MAGVQKELSIAPAQWSPEIEGYIARALQTASLADVKAQVESGAAQLFSVSCDGSVVMAFVLRVDHLSSGSEGVVVAAGGAADGVNLTSTILPAMEKMFVGCATVRIHTARTALWRKLVNDHGYAPQEMVFTKALNHG